MTQESPGKFPSCPSFASVKAIPVFCSAFALIELLVVFATLAGPADFLHLFAPTFVVTSGEDVHSAHLGNEIDE